MGRHEGKGVLLTGAAGGIGRETARRLAGEGARLWLLDRDAGPLEEIAAEIGQQGCFMECDVSDPASVAAAHEAGRGRLGRIDAAVLNAGIEGPIKRIGEFSIEEFDKVIAVNLRGVMLGLMDLMPRMKAEGGGAIVLLASVAGLRGAAGLSPYVASKHAVVGLARSAAQEGAASGVRVVAVAPGPIDTRMMASLDEGRSPGQAAAVRAQVEARIPAGRYGRAEEVASLIAWLASDEARYITGSVHTIDGGMMA
ncbi:MAG: SDR family NAD(P)-dependent oxidoreductase [Pseudomonadota bacterium]|nr:SDR family NAD(P)-dependent oxidoreductase [Pseudomonadota bacterium]MEE3098401.1 SDR family NAD(P)-dependent oxidoreductase [Pseudomonadota bacterium]